MTDKPYHQALYNRRWGSNLLHRCHFCQARFACPFLSALCSQSPDSDRHLYWDCRELLFLYRMLYLLPRSVHSAAGCQLGVISVQRSMS